MTKLSSLSSPSGRAFAFPRAVREFVAHYHGERNHQRLDNRLLTAAAAISTGGRVHRRSRLGGLLNYRIDRVGCRRNEE